MSPMGRIGNEEFVDTKASLQNALSERQIPAMISIHSLNRCTKTGMLEYLVVGSGEGRPADRPNCSPPLIAHHGSFGYDD
jgi:hypothetical protein